MLKKRIIISLTFLDGVLFRTKKFIPDYRYTKEFINLWNIDELVLIDISKKKFSENFIRIVKYYSENCFVPITVGGGIDNINNAKYYFDNGADKIILGFNSLKNKNLSQEIANIYGNQSIIQAVDISKNYNDYFIFSNSGKIKSKISIDELKKFFNEDYIGEILINNIDYDGGMLGFDIDLIKKIEKQTSRPLIALGGGGNWAHFIEVFKRTNISALCTQNIYHFTDESIRSLKKVC